MFAGIVEAMAPVVRIGPGLLVVATPPGFEPLRPGASIAVDGVCLTVTAAPSGSFEVALSEETVRRSTLGALRGGDEVNLERPLRLEDRIGGHLVQGHVDAVGEVASPSPDLRVKIPSTLVKYCVEKGSIAFDGVSLTIAALDDNAVAVAVVPFTAEHTTLGRKGVGRGVNVEVDVTSKQLERLLVAYLAERG